MKREGNTISRKYYLLLLTIILLSTGIKGEECASVPGLGSPVNVFHTFFQNFFDSMSLSNAKNGIRLITQTTQQLEAVVFRFIFKYTTNGEKDYYIGVLTTIPKDKLEEGKLEHKVIRFIQSSDLTDAKRLIGLYDIEEGEGVDCGFKEAFWKRVEQKPFESDKREISHHIKERSSFSVDLNNKKVEEEKNKTVEEDIQKMLAMLEADKDSGSDVNKKESKVVDSRRIVSYDNSDDLNVTTQNDLLNQLNLLNQRENKHRIKKRNLDNNRKTGGLSLTEQLVLFSSNQNGQVIKNPQVVGNQVYSNNNGFQYNSNGYNGYNGNNGYEHNGKEQFNNVVSFTMNNSNNSLNDNDSSELWRTRYKLGDVISGNGKNKIMNPEKIISRNKKHGCCPTSNSFKQGHMYNQRKQLSPDEMIVLLKLQNSQNWPS